MWALLKYPAAVLVTGLALGGCAEVTDPVSPEQARAEVIAAARDIVGGLHAEVTEALFRYESCNDQGEPPFRGVVTMSFWMPGTAHDQPADPQRVVRELTAHGWSGDSDFVSHSPTLRKGDVDVIVTVVPPARPGQTFNSHVGVDINGQCRDTFDHRKNHTILPVDVENEITGG